MLRHIAKHRAGDDPERAHEHSVRRERIREARLVRQARLSRIGGGADDRRTVMPQHHAEVRHVARVAFLDMLAQHPRQVGRAARFPSAAALLAGEREFVLHHGGEGIDGDII